MFVKPACSVPVLWEPATSQHDSRLLSQCQRYGFCLLILILTMFANAATVLCPPTSCCPCHMHSLQ